ncbi:hypothetical protein DXG01_015396 [Tephrocybe rancida]|nr:hypothetical protein DXG01_015396 [Tephrocybe rancida]
MPERHSSENPPPSSPLKVMRPEPDTDMAGHEPQDVLIAYVHALSLAGQNKISSTVSLGRQDPVKARVATVYHGLASGTANVQQYSLRDSEYPTRRIVLIDTPGFDNASIDNDEIMKRIVRWISESYQPDMKLAGIIYLHDITHKRLPRPGLYDKVFKQLCGDDWARKVVLATTMWDEISLQVGERREQDLKKEYWKIMLKLGSRIARYDGTRPSARQLIIPFVAETISAPRYKKARRAFTFPLPSGRSSLFQMLRALF